MAVGHTLLVRTPAAMVVRVLVGLVRPSKLGWLAPPWTYAVDALGFVVAAVALKDAASLFAPDAAIMLKITNKFSVWQMGWKPNLP